MRYGQAHASYAAYGARQPSQSAKRNALLSALPADDFSLLVPHLRTVAIERGSILREDQEQIEHVYFPLSGAASRVAVMGNGATVETTMIGRTGIVGFTAGLGLRRAAGRVVVQIPGEAARIGASQFETAVKESTALCDLVVRYNGLVLAQTQQCVACNALHQLEARLCRFLLHTHDCVDGDAIPLIQETLGQMLGVRRTTLTVVARLLQSSGMIRYRRGLIHVVNRAKLEENACECYGVIKQLTEGLLLSARSAAAAI
jgi:CRP-like cAMP-binding protein